MVKDSPRVAGPREERLRLASPSGTPERTRAWGARAEATLVGRRGRHLAASASLGSLAFGTRPWPPSLVFKIKTFLKNKPQTARRPRPGGRSVLKETAGPPGPVRPQVTRVLPQREEVVDGQQPSRDPGDPARPRAATRASRHCRGPVPSPTGGEASSACLRPCSPAISGSGHGETVSPGLSDVWLVVQGRGQRCGPGASPGFGLPKTVVRPAEAWVGPVAWDRRQHPSPPVTAGAVTVEASPPSRPPRLSRS